MNPALDPGDKCIPVWKKRLVQIIHDVCMGTCVWAQNSAYGVLNVAKTGNPVPLTESPLIFSSTFVFFAFQILKSVLRTHYAYVRNS